MNKYQNLTFQGSEFDANSSSVPYAQFINASGKKHGLGITLSNAEMVGFTPDRNWIETQYEFSDGTEEDIYLSTTPRLSVLNATERPLMSDDQGVYVFDRKTRTQDHRVYSYVVIVPLSQDNKPLSDQPLRLKCSGFAGMSFNQHFDYYTNPDSFTKQYLKIYQELTGDKNRNRSRLFYAHGVYTPSLIRKKVTSKTNNQSSQAVVTDSFITPTKDNFDDLFIPPNSDVSKTLIDMFEDSKDWVDIKRLTAKTSETMEENNDELPYPIESNADQDIKLTPEPISF